MANEHNASVSCDGQAMKPQHHDSLLSTLLAGFLSVLGIVCFAMAAQAADDMVTIQGHLRADDLPLSDALLVVEVKTDEVCLRSELSTDGHFKFAVPVGAKARLIFIKPGYLTKEVEVDTKNAMNTDEARRMNKKVKFDVVLEEELQHIGEVYMGPVGRIHFVNGTGLMRVTHDGRMRAVSVAAEAYDARKD